MKTNKASGIERRLSDRVVFLMEESTRLAQARRWSEALVSSQILLGEDKDNFVGLEVGAKAAWQMHQYTEVLVLTTALLSVNPVEAGYLSLRAMAYQAIGNFDFAKADLERAMSLATNDLTRAKIRVELELARERQSASGRTLHA